MRRIYPAIGLILAVCTAAILFAQSGMVSLPPVEADAPQRLVSSPRHGEWVTYNAGGSDQVKAWVVYPERKDPAPVVIVIHEIFGLTDWIRSVADQLAADGFIAIAPDFLTGKGPDGKGSEVGPEASRGLISTLDPKEIQRRLDGAAAYATSLAAAQKKYAVIGYCWGGAISFTYATQQAGLSAAVVYYGTSPATASLASVRAPVLGLYGGNDARVNATIPAAETEMKRLGKKYEIAIYEGAGHGFLRQQAAQNGANLKATQAAWPRTIDFLKRAFEGRLSSFGDDGPLVSAAYVNEAQAASRSSAHTADMGH